MTKAQPAEYEENSQFAVDLDALMKRYDLSPEAIAEIFGTTSTTIYRWLKGTNKPEHLGMANLALQALHLSYGITRNQKVVDIMEKTRKLNRDAEAREKLRSKLTP